MVILTGVLNLLWVHPVPGIGYLLLSFLYFPPANELLKRKTGISVPPLIKIILGIIMVMFTLGVSDLGDIIDKW